MFQEAHVAIGFEGASWTSAYAFPFMIIQTMLSSWNRFSQRSGASRLQTYLYYCFLSFVCLFLGLSFSVLNWFDLVLFVCRMAMDFSDHDVAQSYMTFNTCYKVCLSCT